VRNTQDIFARHGARSLLVAKFIPGLNTAAPPLAGIVGMVFGRFLMFDIMGTLLWASSVSGLGFLFSDQLEEVAAQARHLGAGLFLVLALALGAFIAVKFIRRRRFMAELRLARITPEELSAKIAAGEDIVIVDLRQSMSFEAAPETIPGARHFTPKEFEQRHQEIPRDREVILYCT
jgi:hypothetical protein